MIGPQDDLRRSALRRQVAQSLRREHQRIEVELLQVFGGSLLKRRLAAILRSEEAPAIGTVGVGGQVSAAVRGADLQPGVAVEHAFENQMGQSDRGLERVADD